MACEKLLFTSCHGRFFLNIPCCYVPISDDWWWYDIDDNHPNHHHHFHHHDFHHHQQQHQHQWSPISNAPSSMAPKKPRNQERARLERELETLRREARLGFWGNLWLGCTTLHCQWFSYIFVCTFTYFSYVYMFDFRIYYKYIVYVYMLWYL